MIFDNKANLEQYYLLDEKFQKAFEFLTKTDLNNINEGKYEISGDDIFANVQLLKTKNKEEEKWEAHRKYIDIQYLINGEECIGIGFLNDFKEVEIPYDDNKDVEFLSKGRHNYVNLKEGDFVIFYPTDVHAPMLKVNDNKDIKKVIVKIKI